MHTSRHPFARGAVALVAIVLAATTLVACGDDGDEGADATTTTGAATEVEVSDAWARAVTDLEASDRSAVYMTITGGSEDDALVAASVPADVAGTRNDHLERRMRLAAEAFEHHLERLKPVERRDDHGAGERG